MLTRFLEQRLNLAGQPTVPFRFFLSKSTHIRHFGSSINYRKIIIQPFERTW